MKQKVLELIYLKAANLIPLDGNPRRVFDNGGRIKEVIPAMTCGEVVAQPLRSYGWGDGISL
ncbi:MAG: hypothetical protein IH886_04465 [Nitrospinae bacterium]|nr:hypothetical protein [Nitrospinota bacterium]